MSRTTCPTCPTPAPPLIRTGPARAARDSYTPLTVPELIAEEFATVVRTSPFGRHLTGNKSNSVKPPPTPPTAPGNTQ